jgi:hypothetical protein
MHKELCNKENEKLSARWMLLLEEEQITTYETSFIILQVRAIIWFFALKVLDL